MIWVLGHGEHRQPWHPHATAFARLLLEHGADPNDGQTLYNRMFGRNDDHLVLLFEYGLGRDTAGPWHRLPGESLESPTEMLRSLRAWAVTHDQRRRVALLAAAGFDVNALGRSDIPSNERWHTALHVAAENGDLTLARTLLDLGTDPNIPDKHYQSTPLGWARHFGQPAVAELLEPVTHQT
jgi:ankyrin repeat protein